MPCLLLQRLDTTHGLDGDEPKARPKKEITGKPGLERGSFSKGWILATTMRDRRSDPSPRRHE